MMSHTPGPWGIQPDGRGGASDTVYAYLDQQQPVAEVVSGVRADRHLIAAAPDLLRELKRMLSLWEEAIGWEEDYMDMGDAARIAIAKANGRSDL
jgi:hypothetical protein